MLRIYITKKIWSGDFVAHLWFKHVILKFSKKITYFHVFGKHSINSRISLLFCYINAVRSCLFELFQLQEYVTTQSLKRLRLILAIYYDMYVSKSIVIRASQVALITWSMLYNC